jgi:hypothetical protein
MANSVAAAGSLDLASHRKRGPYGQLPGREASEALLQALGRGGQQRVQLVGGLRPGLHGRSAGHPHGAQRLRRAVGILRLARSLAREERTGCGLGVAGVGLAVPTAVLWRLVRLTSRMPTPFALR